MGRRCFGAREGENQCCSQPQLTNRCRRRARRTRLGNRVMRLLVPCPYLRSTTMKKRPIFISAGLLFLTALSVAQITKEDKGSAPSHVMVAPNEVKWEANSMIPNTQVAVLDGDPSKAGSFYAIEVKGPDGTIV